MIELEASNRECQQYSDARVAPYNLGCSTSTRYAAMRAMLGMYVLKSGRDVRNLQ